MSQNQNNWQQQVWQQPAAGSVPPTGAPVQPQPPYQQPHPPAPKRSRGWIVAIVGIVAVLVVVVLGMWSCTTVVTSGSGMLGASSASSDDLAALTGDAVGVIDVSGTIQYDGTTASPDGLKAQLDRAADNDRIKAVVLRVDSGGGTATAGEEMATYVRQFREDSGKPVVVSSASMNASAAYEISSQADCIFTAKTTAIGAIGTAMQITDLSELLDKLGISVDNVTSADSKDSSYGTRPLTDEERAYYQNMVNEINETFLQTVADGRGMSVDEVRALATGLTFTGMDAVDNGLADEIGTKEDAVAKASELAGAHSTLATVDLAPSSDGLSDLLGLMSDSNDLSAADVAAALKELESDGTLVR